MLKNQLSGIGLSLVELVVEALIDVITAFVGRNKTEESFRKQRNCEKDAVSYGK